MAEDHIKKTIVQIEHGPGCRCPEHRHKNHKGPHKPQAIVITFKEVHENHTIKVRTRRCANNYHHEPHHRRWWEWFGIGGR